MGVEWSEKAGSRELLAVFEAHNKLCTRPVSRLGRENESCFWVALCSLASFMQHRGKNAEK